MSYGDRARLERLVQDLDREHPDWPSSRLETELEVLSPVGYGNWKENTPNREARLRQVQRWRRGPSVPRTRPTQPLFQVLWPVGERQRHAIEPGFAARVSAARASHRIFLFNCSEETLREIHASIGAVEVAYEPALLPGKFFELHWVRNPAIRESALSAGGPTALRHPLAVTFARSKGLRNGRLDGELLLNVDDGWNGFAAAGGPQKEIE